MIFLSNQMSAKAGKALRFRRQGLQPFGYFRG